MIRIRRGVKVRLVTTYAVRRDICVIPRGVTRRTIRNIMPLRKREEAVIDLSRTPTGHHSMATHAICTKTRSLVIWIRGSVKVRLVTTYAVGGSIRIISCGMTRCTVCDIVPFRKREEAMINLGWAPARHRGMATHAIR